MARAWCLLSFTWFLALAGQTAQAEPPFSGSNSIDPDIITSSDRTAFQGLSSKGQGVRLMFDRRINSFVSPNAYLFDARFDDGLTFEVGVNPEFGSQDAARAVAQKYGLVIGRLPTGLRSGVQTVWIHRGDWPLGGVTGNLLIHTEGADFYESRGILEETLAHEASHASLDAAHAAAPGWLAAQAADREFISTYARDYPTREDVAESFLPYLALRYRSDRLPSSVVDTIARTMPNRIAYFDAHAVSPYPLAGMMLRLNVSAASFAGGATLVVDVVAANAGPAMVVDAYVGMIGPAPSSTLFGCPAGDVVVLLHEGGAGLVTRCFSNGVQRFGKALARVPIAQGLPATAVPGVLRFTWPAGFPSGTYTVFVALTRAEALTDGRIDAADLVIMGTAQVSFTR